MTNVRTSVYRRWRSRFEDEKASVPSVHREVKSSRKGASASRPAATTVMKKRSATAVELMAETVSRHASEVDRRRDSRVPPTARVRRSP
jgi:hypothetical protein